MVLAVGIASGALLFAAAGDFGALGGHDDAKAVASDEAPWRFEVVAVTPAAFASGMHIGALEEPPAASRLRVNSRFLPPGRVNEQGLQVRTILAARAISEEFPQIHDMGGVRPDPKPWHPLGLAVDVMIPDPESADGIALGNQIVAYVMDNASRFGIQDAIWRGVYYTPGGGQSSGGYGHYDHVHVTTTGGGYPTGEEVYLR
jgi:hypothetical protein